MRLMIGKLYLGLKGRIGIASGIKVRMAGEM